jgi:predicted anti-sigma-YlaC factor YlaD
MGPSQAQARQRCDQIREWVSLELDCDLSRIERALVERHLAACADCRAFARDVATFTLELRKAELEPLERPIVLPRRAGVSARSFPVAVAAAVAVAAVGVASLTNSSAQGPASSRARQVTGIRFKDQMRARQMQQLEERVAQTMPRPLGRQPV